MVKLSGKGTDLSLPKRSQLRMRLLQQRVKSVTNETIPCRADFTPCSSSFAQRRLWFFDQFTPGSSVYNIPLAVRLEGDLNLEALEAALNAIVERHGILRTHFEIEDDEPVQVVASKQKILLPLDDLGSVVPEEREEKLQQRMQSETEAPFNLALGPLLRGRLLRLDTRTHVLLVTLHHIIFDGWSMGILVYELSVLYSAFCEDAPSPLPVLSVQYADYAIWQRSRLRDELLQKQLSYWRKQLKDLPVLDLPTDRSRQVMQNFQGAQLHFDLPATLTKRLEELSRRAGVTLFMTLLAAFQVLLQRYSGQDDIAVGSLIAGRNRVELEGLIGFFVNTLVLRTDLSGDPTFMELLGRVRDVALGAYMHQELPFEKLVEELQPQRDLSLNPLFQVLFVLHNTPRTELDLPGIEATWQPVGQAMAKFDLTLSVIQEAEGLRGTFEYDCDLFDAATVKRMAGHFKVLLKSILADAHQKISRLAIMGGAECRQLVVDWNDTACADGPAQLVHKLIEMQVDRTPASIAVGFEDRTLSYQMLDQKANQLAHYLQMMGVGPDILVGVMLERSEEMLVALLGVLKAGGAYVPLDPDYPGARLAYMLEHSGVQVLLSELALLQKLPHNPSQVICVDRDREQISRMAVDRPVASCRPEQPAYVIYTSGSTGKPKGVHISHEAVVNFLNSMSRKPGLNEKDVLLAVTTLSFDPAVLELYLPLIVGGRVQIAGYEVARDGDQLLSMLQQTGTTVMQATPATWRILLSAGWQGSRGFKILCGGEALPRDMVNQLIDRVGGVWNMYGLTESTVWSTCEYLTTKEGPISIGRPISNTRVYVLDKHRQLVPVGVPGELYIGGRGVTRGYLHAQELNQMRFVDDPFAEQPGEYLYRTGDQVRYLADGRLDYLTRLDSQVKVRGFRIELGEIEAVLSTHPAVKQSVVVAHEKCPGDVRLVAYIVLFPEQKVSAAEVRNHLHSTLPGYMIPQHVLELEAVPVTPNGKIDRKMLPSPFSTDALNENIYFAPRTELESALATIWQDVLGVHRVSIHDSFFDLGGHSLLVVKVISRMKEIVSANVTLRMFFKHTTIAEQTTILELEQSPADLEVESILRELEALPPEEQVAVVLANKRKC